jgi:hypothetical protein
MLSATVKEAVADVHTELRGEIPQFRGDRPVAGEKRRHCRRRVDPARARVKPSYADRHIAEGRPKRVPPAKKSHCESARTVTVSVGKDLPDGTIADRNYVWEGRDDR